MYHQQQGRFKIKELAMRQEELSVDVRQEELIVWL